MKALIRPFLRRFERIWYRPSFRYSVYFHSIQGYFRWHPREYIMNEAMNFVSASELEGDYLEFGTFRGATFVSAYHFARLHRLRDMHFYGFDSFEGLPETKGLDANSEFAARQYACDLADFKNILKQARVPARSVTLTKGWFDQSLTEELRAGLSLKKAALIWVDCDLYSSTIPVLEWIVPYLQPGTVLIFDDWYCFKGDPRKGEQRAAAEWLERHPQWQLIPWRPFGWAGMSFLVHEK
jgi:hypothetical protein